MMYSILFQFEQAHFANNWDPRLLVSCIIAMQRRQHSGAVPIMSEIIQSWNTNSLWKKFCLVFLDAQHRPILYVRIMFNFGIHRRINITLMLLIRTP